MNTMIRLLTPSSLGMTTLVMSALTILPLSALQADEPTTQKKTVFHQVNHLNENPRMRYHSGYWWYQRRDGRWMYHRNGDWHYHQPARHRTYYRGDYDRNSRYNRYPQQWYRYPQQRYPYRGNYYPYSRDYRRRYYDADGYRGARIGAEIGGAIGGRGGANIGAAIGGAIGRDD